MPERDRRVQPQYQGLWYSLDALELRSGTSEDYGRAQLEALIARLGEVIEQFSQQTDTHAPSS